MNSNSYVILAEPVTNHCMDRCRMTKIFRILSILPLLSLVAMQAAAQDSPARFYKLSFVYPGQSNGPTMLVREDQPATMISGKGEAGSSERKIFVLVRQTDDTNKALLTIMHFTKGSRGWVLMSESELVLAENQSAPVQLAEGSHESDLMAVAIKRISRDELPEACTAFDKKRTESVLPSALSSSKLEAKLFTCCTSQGSGCQVYCCGGCCRDPDACPGASCCP